VTVKLFQTMRGTIMGNSFFWFSQYFGITGVLYCYTYDYCNYWYKPGGEYFWDKECCEILSIP